MTAFRCTGKLLTAMKASPVAEPAPATNKLGEWTAHLIRASRHKLVLAVSEPTRMGVVIDAAPCATVPRRFCRALSAALLDLGVDPALSAAELTTMQPLQLASSNSQSMLSAINHFTHDVQRDLRHGNASLTAELTCRLAGRVVLSPAHVEFPGDRVREAFGLPPLDTKEWVAAMLWPPGATLRWAGCAGPFQYLECAIGGPWVIPPISQSVV